MFKDWKTTLGGIVGGLGVLLAFIPEPAWVAYLGQGLTAIALIFTGVNAKDYFKIEKK